MKKYKISFSIVINAESEEDALDKFSSQNYPSGIYEFEELFTVEEIDK